MAKSKSSRKSSIYDNKSMSSMTSMSPGDKQKFSDNIITNTFFISIIYNLCVLGYILNIESKDCNCFRDWRHNFMKYYSILLIIWSILNITFKLYNSKNELVNVINTITMFAYIINMWCLYTYVGILDYTKCSCAIDKSKKMHYFLYLFRYVIVGLIFISLFSVIFTTLNKK